MTQERILTKAAGHSQPPTKISGDEIPDQPDLRCTN